jgi:Ca2+-binding RTX toxin-like protein
VFDDAIVGGPGDDVIIGGGGRDVLVGGGGLDRLDGGDEDDLLVAGVPSIVGLYDLDDFSPARLHGAFAWWSAADDAYDQRATVAERGADAVYLSSQQLFDDAAVDRLAGGGGRDLWVTNDQPGGGASGWWT